MLNNDYKEERKNIAQLIYMVLAETLHVREALLKFPNDMSDSTIKTAYHALVHFEADEDYRKKDLEYKEEQDDYLEFIAQTLEKGDDLPENIIRSYKKYYKSIDIPHTGKFKGILKSLCKFLNV